MPLLAPLHLFVIALLLSFNLLAPFPCFLFGLLSSLFLLLEIHRRGQRTVNSGTKAQLRMWRPTIALMLRVETTLANITTLERTQQGVRLGSTNGSRHMGQVNRWSTLSGSR